ncbi:hypothetical protein VH12019_00125 [Vibrio phage VH1_2019]|uniref:Uncharacterized protein n=1 Tax=Vibrio phage VH1_2019 TaxID=2686307 RepID=A0A6B9SZ33_9CAUD|nr:hypothetical protein VH12019_00125 [Vibrio phage VH1_2019]
MKKVRYVVTDFMLGIGGGIYTFIQDHVRLMQSLNCDVKVIVLGDESCPHVSKWDFECDFILTKRSYKDYKANAMVINAIDSEAIIYTHSYEALRACIEAKRRCYNQHHFGDLIVPDSYREYMDIHQIYNLPQWRHMMSTSLVTNIAQSNGIAQWGREVIGGKHVTAFEPFELPSISQADIDAAEASDVIIVSGAYKRKQIPEMLNALAYSGLKIRLFTTESIRIPSGVDCIVETCQRRERVIAHMMKSKVLLHMSRIEIMPYALLEACQYIPCIVQHDAPYTRDFIFPVIRADINNDTLIRVIDDAIEQKYQKFDIEKYRQDAKTHWKELWGL